MYKLARVPKIPLVAIICFLIEFDDISIAGSEKLYISRKLII
jgi:hypothetical protein